MIYRFKTSCSPDANGRTPLAGEVKHTARFTTDDGAQLEIEIGEQARQTFLTMLGWQGEDDAKKISLLEARIRVLEAEARVLRARESTR